MTKEGLLFTPQNSQEEAPLAPWPTRSSPPSTEESCSGEITTASSSMTSGLLPPSCNHALTLASESSVSGRVAFFFGGGDASLTYPPEQGTSLEGRPGHADQISQRPKRPFLEPRKLSSGKRLGLEHWPRTSRLQKIAFSTPGKNGLCS